MFSAPAVLAQRRLRSIRTCRDPALLPVPLPAPRLQNHALSVLGRGEKGVGTIPKGILICFLQVLMWQVLNFILDCRCLILTQLSTLVTALCPQLSPCVPDTGFLWSDRTASVPWLLALSLCMPVKRSLQNYIDRPMTWPISTGSSSICIKLHSLFPPRDNRGFNSSD